MTPPTVTSPSTSTFRSAALACALACASLAAGCASADGNRPPPTFDGPPLVEATSSSGALHLAVRASPSPPTSGVCTLELVVRDVAGAPVDGLAIGIVPWMPAMGHGSSVVPTVSAEGGGTYLASGVSFSMPGRWILRTTLTHANESDAADFALDVR